MKTFFAYAGLPLGLFVVLPLVLSVGLGLVLGDMASLVPLMGFSVGIGAMGALVATVLAWGAYALVRRLLQSRGSEMPRGSRVALSALATVCVLIPMWPFLLLMFMGFTGASFS